MGRLRTREKFTITSKNCTGSGASSHLAVRYLTVSCAVCLLGCTIAPTFARRYSLGGMNDLAWRIDLRA
jgi:hypothetical protein